MDEDASRVLLAGEPPGSGPRMGPGLLGPRDSAWAAVFSWRVLCLGCGGPGAWFRHLGFRGHMGSVVWLSGLQNAKHTPRGVQTLGEAEWSPSRGTRLRVDRLGCVGGGRRLAERGASGSLGRTPAAPQRPKGHSRSQGQCQDCQPAGLGAGGSGSTSLVWVCVSDTGLPGTPPCGSRATEIWVKGTGQRGEENQLGACGEGDPAATPRPPCRHHWATCSVSTCPLGPFIDSHPATRTEWQGLCVCVFSLGCHQDVGGRGAGRSVCRVLPGVSLGLEGRAGLCLGHVATCSCGPGTCSPLTSGRRNSGNQAHLCRGVSLTVSQAWGHFSPKSCRPMRKQRVRVGPCTSPGFRAQAAPARRPLLSASVRVRPRAVLVTRVDRSLLWSQLCSHRCSQSWGFVAGDPVPVSSQHPRSWGPLPRPRPVFCLRMCLLWAFHRSGTARK